MVESVSFDLPKLTETQMTWGFQHNLILNQATSVIVSAYLKHATSIYQQLISDGASESIKQTFRITPTELPNLIDSVQQALKSLP